MLRPLIQRNINPNANDIMEPDSFIAMKEHFWDRFHHVINRAYQENLEILKDSSFLKQTKERFNQIITRQAIGTISENMVTGTINSAPVMNNGAEDLGYSFGQIAKMVVKEYYKYKNDNRLVQAARAQIFKDVIDEFGSLKKTTEAISDRLTTRFYYTLKELNRDNTTRLATFFANCFINMMENSKILPDSPEILKSICDNIVPQKESFKETFKNDQEFKEIGYTIYNILYESDYLTLQGTYYISNNNGEPSIYPPQCLGKNDVLLLNGCGRREGRPLLNLNINIERIAFDIPLTALACSSKNTDETYQKMHNYISEEPKVSLKLLRQMRKQLILSINSKHIFKGENVVREFTQRKSIEENLSVYLKNLIAYLQKLYRSKETDYNITDVKFYTQESEWLAKIFRELNKINAERNDQRFFLKEEVIESLNNLEKMLVILYKKILNVNTEEEDSCNVYLNSLKIVNMKNKGDIVEAALLDHYKNQDLVVNYHNIYAKYSKQSKFINEKIEWVNVLLKAKSVIDNVRVCSEKELKQHVDAIATMADTIKTTGYSSLIFTAIEMDSCDMLQEINLIRKLDDKLLVEISDDKGNTPLHFAILKGKISVFTYFIENMIKCEKENNDQLTPLMLLAKKINLFKDGTILELLEKWEIKSFDNPNRRRETPLFHAIEAKNILMIIFLIKKGADLSFECKNGETLIEKIKKDQELFKKTEILNCLKEEKYLSSITSGYFLTCIRTKFQKYALDIVKIEVSKSYNLRIYCKNPEAMNEIIKRINDTNNETINNLKGYQAVDLDAMRKKKKEKGVKDQKYVVSIKSDRVYGFLKYYCNIPTEVIAEHYETILGKRNKKEFSIKHNGIIVNNGLYSLAQCVSNGFFSEIPSGRISAIKSKVKNAIQKFHDPNLDIDPNAVMYILEGIMEDLSKRNEEKQKANITLQESSTLSNNNNTFTPSFQKLISPAKEEKKEQQKKLNKEEESDQLEIVIRASLETYQQEHGAFKSDEEREMALKRFQQELKEEVKHKKKK